ncbi:hypothetical protein PGB90_007082 [Kerria lacca]
MLVKNLRKQGLIYFQRCFLNSLQRNYSTTLPLTLFTDEELAIKNQIAKIAAETIAPYVKKMEKEGKIANEVMESLLNNGLMGMEAPAEFGGSEFSFITTILAIEEIAKVDPSVAALVDIHNTLVVRFLKIVGNQAQKEKYLRIVATKGAGSFCLSEPNSGSDAFALKTTAKLVGDKYVLNGTKMWISNSDIAEVYIVMANAAPEKGYKGITCFIVERDNPGLTVGKKEDKLGIKASGTCVLHFDNCEVPKEDVLGEVGHGYKYAIQYLNEGRIGIGAQMIGIAQGALNATIPYMFERKQFNQKLFYFQTVQHQISRLITELESARLLVYNAARLVDVKQPVVKEAAMAKYYSSGKLAGKVTSECIDLMGGVGYTTDFPQEKFFRDAKIGTIYEGTTNMMLHTISKCIEKEYE